MKKISISSAVVQSMTADEIKALAMDIIVRKGNVDMSGCNMTITPPTDMDAFMSGLIVRCAKENNGSVKIEGYSEIDDDVWNYIKSYGCPLWMIAAHNSYGIPIKNLMKACSVYGTKIIESGIDGTSCIMTDKNSYFNTKIYPTDDIDVELEMSINSFTEYGSFFGCMIASAYFFFSNDTSLVMNSAVGQKQKQHSGFNLELRKKINIHFHKTYLSYNDIDYSTECGESVALPYELPLYLNQIINANYVLQGKCQDMNWYKFRIKKNGILTNFIIPCASNTLLDLITGEALVNQGTGTAKLVY